jgi:uncharacterized glyoxalase superfamily protein PhnB
MLLTFVAISCTNSKSKEDNNSEIEKLRLENDSLKKVLVKNKEEMKLEINMIVADAKEAGDYYKKVLNAEIISQTDKEAGLNETMMKLGGVEIRVLDENKDFGLFAPADSSAPSMGINLFVNDIDAFFDNAVKEGCNIISPVQDFPDIPAKNAVFSDKFNHVWVVNQQY